MQPFVGQIILTPLDFAPQDWLTCDGRLLLIQEYPALFELIGTAFGGDGNTTFAIPDLRSRTPIGAGQGPGLSPYRIGDQAGAETVSVSASQLPVHTHIVSASGNAATSLQPQGMYFSATINGQIYGNSGSGLNHLSEKSVSQAGAGYPHDNRQPYLALNWIISTSGIFPQQS